jgi:hypothetical protein
VGAARRGVVLRRRGASARDPEPVRTPEGDGVEWSTGHVRRAVRLSSVHGRHGVENLHWLPDIPNLET